MHLSRDHVTPDTCPRCGAHFLAAEPSPWICPRCILGLAAPLTGQAPTTSIRDYILTRVIGEGGMGIVHLAEEQQPPRRTVAIKVIRAGMDSKQILARFQLEREALILMDHPCIAKVLDAGETDQGLPYFAMEYIDGEPITTYCDHNTLGTRDRLQLFLRVCEGVQHAHQKGIIHRDLKPSNILVTRIDDELIPKIIDFGVAKATAQEALSITLFTELGMLIGTPEYMSPEQAGLHPADIDTRADVYTLGMVLYELLSGALPFDARELRKAGLDEIRRRIREVDAPRPSVRVNALGHASTEAARNRKTEPYRLVSQLRGDLDWITIKALEKDRARRYSSPSDLAADISRHLHDEPVLAEPPSAVYRARKFIRRHRAGVGIAAILLVSLAYVAISSRLQSSRLAKERDRANSEAAAARQVSDFLTDLFHAPDPHFAAGNELTVREILDRGSTKILEELKGQPALQARLMSTMGGVYLSLGQYEQAERLLDQSLEKRKALYGERSAEVAEVLELLGNVYDRTERSKEAVVTLRTALEIREWLPARDGPEMAETLSSLGEAYWFQNELQQSRASYERALEIRKKIFGPEAPQVGKTLKDLGDIAFVQSDYRTARPLYQQALTILDRNPGTNQPTLVALLTNYGYLLFEIRHYDAARPLLKRSVELSEKILGPTHPELAGPLNNYGRMLVHDKDYPEAERLFERALAISEKALGHMHRDVAMSLDNLGSLLLATGEDGPAARNLNEALRIWTHTVGPDDADTAMTLYRLATLKERQGDLNEATAMLERVLRIRQKELGDIHPELAETFESLGRILRKRGKLTEARAYENSAATIWNALDGLPG